MNKIQLAFKARKKFKNWRILVNLYFKKIKEEHVILETKNNIKIKYNLSFSVFFNLEFGCTEFVIKHNVVLEVN